MVPTLNLLLSFSHFFLYFPCRVIQVRSKNARVHNSWWDINPKLLLRAPCCRQRMLNEVLWQSSDKASQMLTVGAKVWLSRMLWDFSWGYDCPMSSAWLLFVEKLYPPGLPWVPKNKFNHRSEKMKKQTNKRMAGTKEKKILQPLNKGKHL